MFFFRKAHSLYKMQVPKELSPSFWDGEARDPADWVGFPAVLPGIEHELGTGCTFINLCCRDELKVPALIQGVFCIQPAIQRAQSDAS